MSDWCNSDLEAALRRAFVDHSADYIIITNRREQFQIESANYGIDQGWLNSEWVERDEQSAAFVCRLTAEGKKHFGLDK
jgi:uncharacterized protein YbdZ (MbtH family)